MDQQKQQLVDRIKQAQNILVTVSANPSVDQLSAAMGLTIALNKLDKHGTAVFSGEVPSTIDFLKPEETLEKNTDSLRDFIIALDKSKADKLRYKVEDEVVRIFITPYKTSLSQNDLDFSQGDFNVDVVVALGVTEQQDLDVAITSHGRILHDATVVSISTQGQGSLGSINWVDPSASSLSEMMVNLIDGLDKKTMDNQIATALLTGIVATTERFRNDKTTPKTMSASAELMAAGANQQLIATELETPPELPAEPNASNEPQNPGGPTAAAEPKPEPGTLEIDHEDEEEPEAPQPEKAPEEPQPQVHVDENGQLLTEEHEDFPKISKVRGVGSDGQPTEAGHPEVTHERLTEPPKLNDTDLTANLSPEDEDLPTEELTLPSLNGPILSHNESVLPPAESPFGTPTPDEATHFDTPAASAPFTPPGPQSAPPAWQPPGPSAPSAQGPVFTPNPAPDPIMPPSAPAQAFDPDSTLSEIEESVDSPHVRASDSSASVEPTASVDDARSAVEAALNGSTASSDPLQPIAALNAQPLGEDLHAPETPDSDSFMPPAPMVPNTGFSEPTPGNTPADDALDMPLPSNPFGPGQPAAPAAGSFAPPLPPVPQTPPSSFPSVPQQGSGQTPPPPVPPPMLPPLQ